MKQVNTQAKAAPFKIKTNLKAGPGRPDTRNRDGRDPDRPNAH
jgi:hypothetical protein